jgi:hypothetical protein
MEIESEADYGYADDLINTPAKSNDNRPVRQEYDAKRST